MMVSMMMILLRYTSLLLLHLTTAAPPPTACLAAAFSSAALPPRYVRFSLSKNRHHDDDANTHSSKTALCNNNNKLPFCAEADMQGINLINSSDDNTINDEIRHDLSSARGWMEHIEQSEGPKYGVGAYTVLRCDATFPTILPSFIIDDNNNNSNTPNNSKQMMDYCCEWKIWGEKFHMNRLSSSFKTLTENLFGAADTYQQQQQQIGSFYNNGGSYSGITSISGMGSSVHTDSMFTQSIEETTHVITTLLEQATRSIHGEMQQRQQQQQQFPFASQDSYNLLQQNGENCWTQTLMLTILWTPSRQYYYEGGGIKPLVRGHAAFATTAAAQPAITTNNNIDGSLLPTPITACVAIPKLLKPEALSVLPRRHGMNLNQQRQVGASASAKVSSWCRIRRPLEDPNRYKPHGVVGEVILVRQPDTERGTNIMTHTNENFVNTLELLEGLISNLFVVYRDGTVRTAPVGLVLPGYARHLIIQELNERGLKVDASMPPTMQDMIDGLWSEVFVTSAVRLVTPVERIIMPPVGTNDQPSILWEAPNDKYERHRAAKMIKSSIYQRGWTQATVKNVTVYCDVMSV
jgi:hypothetical protein